MYYGLTAISLLKLLDRKANLCLFFLSSISTFCVYMYFEMPLGIHLFPFNANLTDFSLGLISD